MKQTIKERLSQLRATKEGLLGSSISLKGNVETSVFLELALSIWTRSATLITMTSVSYTI